MSATDWSVTNRGFAYTEIPFRDYEDSNVRIMQVQESSLATERKLWVGPKSLYADLSNGTAPPVVMERAHLGEDEVRALRDALTDWLEAGE